MGVTEGHVRRRVGAMSSRGALVAALLVVAGIVGYLMLGRGGDGPPGSATTAEPGARPSGDGDTRPFTTTNTRDQS